MRRRAGMVLGTLAALATGGLVFLAAFAGPLEFKAQGKSPAEKLIQFAETFLPLPIQGKLEQEGDKYIYRNFEPEKAPDSAPRQMKFAAEFSRDAGRSWVKRDDSSFGLGMKALFLAPSPKFFKQPAAIAEIRNGRVVYQAGKGLAIIYTPIKAGVREDILVASAKDLARVNLRWELELDSHLEARPLPDGAIGIYGPSQYLWGNIQIGDEKSAGLVEQARKNAPKDSLLYKIPLPVIREANSRERKDICRFSLEGKMLSLAISGLRSLRYPISIDPSVVVTLTADFSSRGTNEGQLNISSDQIQRAGVSAGTGIGSWSSTTQPGSNAGPAYAAYVVYNGYFYKIGGHYGGTPTNEVLFAPFNANGTLGTWASTTAFSTARTYLSAAVYNGYLYILGGDTVPAGGAVRNDVQFASINANGTLGAWTTTTAFTTARRTHTSAAANGYLYVIGGTDGANPLGDVQVAPFNANGTVGTWSTTTALPAVRNGPAAVVANGYLYVTGGNNGSAYVNDVYLAPLNANGTVGTWVATTAFSTIRANHTAVAYNGYLYLLGGWNGSYLNDVQVAPINANGTLGSWVTTTAFTTGRYGMGTAAYNGYLYVMGGHNPTNSFLYDVQYAPLNASGTIGAWTTTTAFTPARAYHTTVAYNGYLYLIGGFNWPNNYNDVQYAPLNADGTLGAWTATTAFTTARGTHASIAYNGFLYVIGGSEVNSSGSLVNYKNDVQVAPINANGTIGAWTTTTALPAARVKHTAVAYNGYLYVLGGWDGATTYYNDVQYAPINANGTIGAWATTTAFTTGRWGHASLAYNGYLYVIGGRASYSNPVDDLSDVQYAPINANGTIGAWATTIAFTNARTMLGSVAYNGYLYVIGGEYQYASGGYYSDAQCAPINANGTVGTWTTLASFTTGRGALTSTVASGYLYVLGGYTYGAYLGDAQVAKINASSGLVSNWAATTSFTSGRNWHASVTYNNYLYMVGGYCYSCGSTGSNFETVQYAPINANGTVGSWTATSSFTTARTAASLAYNGYLYLLGGSAYSNTYFSDVQYAPINANGTLGAWAATTAFPTLRSCAAAAYNGYLYSAGGYNGSAYVNNVLYAPINANGTIGAWTATTALPTIRSAPQVAYNGYLYMVGGYNGATSSYVADVLVAPINADGTLGAWAATTSLPRVRGGHAVVAANGYLYAIGGLDSTGNNDVNYVDVAPINANGTLGSWDTTAPIGVAAAGRGVAAAVANGNVYVTGGYSGAFLTGVQYGTLQTPMKKGFYSKLVDLSSDNNISSLVINGASANKGTIRLQYRIAPNATAVFGAESVVDPVALGGSINLGSTSGRYLWLRMTLDDTYAAAVNPDATNQRDVTDFTVTYTPPGPAIPTLSSPADAATAVAVNPTLSWNASSGATSYGLQVATDAGFTALVYNTTGIATTSYQLSSPALNNSTVYYWRVNATNVGGTSGWSSVRSFTTIVAAPSVPNLSSPANATRNVTINLSLSWSAATNADSYHLQVATDSGFTALVYDITGIVATTYAVSLAQNTTYYWKVRGYNNTSGYGSFSSVYSFTTVASMKLESLRLEGLKVQ